VEGRLVDASNLTLFCRLGGPDGPAAIYKPIRGERPLWDFPDGTLAGREVATYLISDALDLGIVPRTVLRDGPFGPGMVQEWVETVDDVELVQIARDDEGDLQLTHSDHPALRLMALFDVLVNNADRKGSHVLVTPTGELRGIDHGLCLHSELKLRTVLWGWSGEQLTSAERALTTDLRTALTGALGEALAALLTAHEIEALDSRAVGLLSEGCFPDPGDRWPAIPWPPV
jgi:uncharacterized repeat protein (TIGR03843 family)